MQKTVEIPHTRVTRKNIKALLPLILQELDKCSLVSVDAEFSGLGRDKLCKAENMETRYSALRKLVNDYSLLSLGLCLRSFTVDSSSLSFLVDNGLDLNEIVTLGIPFESVEVLQTLTKPAKQQSAKEETNPICVIFEKLVQISQEGNVSLLMHNGLLDLMHVYNAFYAPLPSTFSSFCADLQEMFPGGLLDTKYISNYEIREDKNYLLYLFAKYHRFHERRKHEDKPHLELEIEGSIDVVGIDTFPCSKVVKQNSALKEAQICEMFMYHGHCKLGTDCKNSHDIQRILEEEEDKLSNKKRNKNCNEKPFKVSTQLKYPHAAFFDAFMTAFVYLHQSKFAEGAGDKEAQNEKWKNKIYLMGKQIPLRIEKSKFAKTSENHSRKKLKLTRNP